MKILSFDTVLRIAAAGAVFGVLAAALGVVFALDVRFTAIVAAAGAGVFSALLVRHRGRASE